MLPAVVGRNGSQVNNIRDDLGCRIVGDGLAIKIAPTDLRAEAEAVREQPSPGQTEYANASRWE